MSLGVLRWAESRTYSFALLLCTGSFCLDFFKGAGTYGAVVPAAFALIAGRIYREVKLNRPDPPIRHPLTDPTGVRGPPGGGQVDNDTPEAT